uniref:Low-density lipoprotein receptor domain class A n=1 Tax=Lates calcarifer TaxID=8187 RepID=A0A4W6BNN9_LATCA
MTTTEPPALTSASACITPSVLCPGSSLCISQNQLVVIKFSHDRRKCVSKMEVCDGRAHCPDGSDERQCQLVCFGSLEICERQI